MNDLDNGWEIKKIKAQTKKISRRLRVQEWNLQQCQKIWKSEKPLFSTTNRFGVQSQNDNEVFVATPQATTSNEVISAELIKPPPPIFVRGVLEFKDLYWKICKVIDKDKFLCKSSTDRLKIHTATPEAYWLLVHNLKSNNTQFHTYQLTEDKPIRVVMTNIQLSTDINEIKKVLTELPGLSFFRKNVVH